MNGNDLLNMIGQVENKYIEMADKMPEKNSRRIVKWCALAACMGVAFLGVWVIGLQVHRNTNYTGNADNNMTFFVDNDTQTKEDNTDKDSKENTTDTETQVNNTDDNTPVNYKDLHLGTSDDNDIDWSITEALSIAKFDEKFLTDSDVSMIIEGTIIDMYKKTYKYDISSDKFEQNGTLHCLKETVVYKISVEKTWFGKDVSGEIITVEDDYFFTETIFKMKKGRKYVIPVYKMGDSILYGYEKEEYISGDINRESIYSSVYPYHPQIEVTTDGKYVVCEDWKTLVSGKRKEIIIDDYDEENYPYFKMYLIEGEVFSNKMMELTDKLK